jgi:hypothetical protein
MNDINHDALRETLRDDAMTFSTLESEAALGTTQHPR